MSNSFGADTVLAREWQQLHARLAPIKRKNRAIFGPALPGCAGSPTRPGVSASVPGLLGDDESLADLQRGGGDAGVGGGDLLPLFAVAVLGLGDAIEGVPLLDGVVAAV